MRKTVIFLMCIIAIIVLFIADANEDYKMIISRKKDMNYLAYNLVVSINKNVTLTQDLITVSNKYAKKEKKFLNNAKDALLKVVRAATIKEKVDSYTKSISSYNKLIKKLEKYPDLIESERFIKLENEISLLRKKIETLKVKYNKTVDLMNNNIKEFAYSKKLKLRMAEYL